MQVNNDLKFASKNSLLFVIILFSIFMFTCFFSFNVTAITYTPASPSGPSSGFENNEYEYIMPTTESGSSWMFDWGDGTYSDWIQVDLSNNRVSEKHSWSQPGTYNVRIKYLSKYLEESKWSSPLVVAISLQTDQNDEDIDGEDIQDFENAISINIGGNIHYLFDSDQNIEIDSFYNTLTNCSTEIVIQADGTCWIDFDNDLDWDYIYSFVDKSVKPFVSKSESKSSFGFPWLTAAVTIVLVVLVVIFLLFKAGVFYIYEEEYEVEE